MKVFRASLAVVLGALTPQAGPGSAVPESPSTAPAELLDSVSNVAWRIELPEGAGRPAAGGPGLLLLVLDGVIAVDGRTGGISWRYHSDAEAMSDVLGTPDGQSVLLVSRVLEESAVTVLDGATGDERFEFDPNDNPEFGYAAGLTNDALVLTDGDTHLWGVSLQDGSELWSTTLADTCEAVGTSPNATHPTGLLVPCSAENRSGFVFIDGATGEVRWSHRGTAESGGGLRRAGSSDGLVAYLPTWDLGDGESGGAIIDVESGRVLAPGPFDGQLVHGGVAVRSTSDGALIHFEDLDDGGASTVQRPCACSNPLAILPAGVLWSTARDGGPIAFQNADDGLLQEIDGVSAADFPNSMIATIVPGSVVVGDGMVSFRLVGLQ